MSSFTLPGSYHTTQVNRDYQFTESILTTLETQYGQNIYTSTRMKNIPQGHLTLMNTQKAVAVATHYQALPLTRATSAAILADSLIHYHTSSVLGETYQYRRVLPITHPVLVKLANYLEINGSPEERVATLINRINIPQYRGQEYVLTREPLTSREKEPVLNILTSQDPYYASPKEAFTTVIRELISDVVKNSVIGTHLVTQNNLQHFTQYVNGQEDNHAHLIANQIVARTIHHEATLDNIPPTFPISSVVNSIHPAEYADTQEYRAAISEDGHHLDPHVNATPSVNARLSSELTLAIYQQLEQYADQPFSERTLNQIAPTLLPLYKKVEDHLKQTSTYLVPLTPHSSAYQLATRTSDNITASALRDQKMNTIMMERMLQHDIPASINVHQPSEGIHFISTVNPSEQPQLQTQVADILVGGDGNGDTLNRLCEPDPPTQTPHALQQQPRR